MRLKVLGAYGSCDATHNLTGYLLEDRVAVDAGTLTSKLTLAQQARIETVYVTHAHADHIRDLPHLILNRLEYELPPIRILAEKSVMDQLMAHVFNGQVWPDFAEITSPSTGKPPVVYRSLSAGRKVMVDNVGFTAVPVDHVVAAAGVIVEINGQSVIFTGDTGPTSDIWKKTNKLSNVAAIVTEASFPNDFQQVSTDSGHMTPNDLDNELKKITVEAPVYASHRKLPYEKKIESEIRNIRDRRARILVEKQYTF